MAVKRRNIGPQAPSSRAKVLAGIISVYSNRIYLMSCHKRNCKYHQRILFDRIRCARISRLRRERVTWNFVLRSTPNTIIKRIIIIRYPHSHHSGFRTISGRKAVRAHFRLLWRWQWNASAIIGLTATTAKSGEYLDILCTRHNRK